MPWLLRTPSRRTAGLPSRTLANDPDDLHLDGHTGNLIGYVHVSRKRLEQIHFERVVVPELRQADPDDAGYADERRFGQRLGGPGLLDGNRHTLPLGDELDAQSSQHGLDGVPVRQPLAVRPAVVAAGEEERRCPEVIETTCASKSLD